MESTKELMDTAPAMRSRIENLAQHYGPCNRGVMAERLHHKSSTRPARISLICGKLSPCKMPSRFQFARVWALGLAVFLLAPFLHAQPGAAGGATITFRKVFKSSYPEFVEIKVPENGACTADIRQLTDDPSPQPFQLNLSVVQHIFDLAGELHDFNGVNLEIHRRIANLGEKTFVYQNGSQVFQTSFNYSTNPSAEELVELFENLAREQIDLSDLQRTMQYDHLGVNDVLLRIEKDYDEKALPDPSALLGALDQLASDNTYIDIARERARTLAGRIRTSR